MSNQSSVETPVLVTGGTGHTGRRLVTGLLKQDRKVRILTREPSKIDLELRKQVEIVRGSITCSDTANRAVRGCGAVLAVTHIKLAPYIISAMQEAGVRRGIFMSSTRRFTRFVEETARQVIKGEEAVERSGLDWTIIRPTMIYGGKQDNNLQPLLDLLQKLPVFPLPGGGKMLWQPVFTWDVVAAMMAALDRAHTIGKAYTIAGPEAITYKQMIQTILEEARLRRVLLPVPLRGARRIVQGYEKLVAKPLVRVDQIQRMEEDKHFDISDAVRDLDFQPVPFREGIRRKIAGDA